MVPKLVFEATGEYYLWPVQVGEVSVVVAHSVLSFVRHKKTGHCVPYAAAGIL